MRNLILSATIAFASFATYAQEAVLPFKEGKKWGLLSLDGKTLIEPTYKDMKPFSKGGVAPVYDFKKKGWMLVDINNNVLELPYKEFVPKKYYGFNHGNSVQTFKGGAIQVQVGDKIALINDQGKEIYPPEFEKISQFNEGIAIGKSGSKWYLLSPDGNKKEIAISAMDVHYLKNGFAPFRASDKKWGFINSKGEKVIDAQFKNVGYFHNGLAWARTMDGKVGYINTSGEWVMQPEYDAGTDFDNDAKIVRVRKGEAWMYLRKNGETFSIPNALKLGKFSGSIAWVRVGELIGFVGTDGKWLVEPEFNAAKDLKNGVALVKKGASWGAINEKGESVLEVKYEKISDARQGLLFIRKGGLVGVVDTKGNLKFDPKYNTIKDFYEGYAIARHNGKWGLIDMNGNWIVQPEHGNLRRATILD